MCGPSGCGRISRARARTPPVNGGARRATYGLRRWQRRVCGQRQPSDPRLRALHCHVIDDLAGVVVDGTTPQGGFNGDGHYAGETELSGPRGIAATRSALLMVGDTGNRRVRQVGPGPANSFEGERSPDVATLWVGLKNSDDIGLRLDLF